MKGNLEFSGSTSFQVGLGTPFHSPHVKRDDSSILSDLHI